MKGFRFTIRNKIIIGFFALIAIFAGNASYVVYVLYQGNKDIRQSQMVITPISDAVKDFTNLVTNSKMYTTNWVYLQSNEDDKNSLRAIHDYEYFDIKERILKYADQVQYADTVAQPDSILQRFEELLVVEKSIMQQLAGFDDYEDPMTIFLAEDAVEGQVLPLSADIIKMLNGLNDYLTQMKTKNDGDLMRKFNTLINTTAILAIVLLFIGFILAFSISNAITKPIKYLRSMIDKLGKGELVKIDRGRLSNDEIGDMAKSLSEMTEGFGDIAIFAKDIGDGKYDSEFKPLSEIDMLGNALLEMRANLKKVAEEDRKRNWATSGLAKFGDILRSYSNNFEKLADEIVSNLVKYIRANQGAMFIVKHDEGSDEEEFMELAACYAWDKKKYLEKRIYRGEGLSGQAWIEGDVVYLTEVPEDYVSITSGLGEANPRSVLIVPLKVNEEVFGVIEMASFKVYEKFEIEFVERIGESIASTISSVKVNERTQILLEESTMMTEQMRAQEEEMRQNMEELQATQEKIERDQSDREAREKIILSDTVLLELTKSFVIRSANEVCEKVFGYAPSELEGKMIKDMMIDTTDLNLIRENALADTFWNGTLKMKSRNGEEKRLIASAGQLVDLVSGDHIFVIYGKDITHHEL
jgi:PAS domain S-box-containing protein